MDKGAAKAERGTPAPRGVLNRKMVTQLTAAMKRCFAGLSIFQNTMFRNVDDAAVVATTQGC